MEIKEAIEFLLNEIVIPFAEDNASWDYGIDANKYDEAVNILTRYINSDKEKRNNEIIN